MDCVDAYASRYIAMDSVGVYAYRYTGIILFSLSCCFRNVRESRRVALI
jgi:hypothetical protein